MHAFSLFTACELHQGPGPARVVPLRYSHARCHAWATHDVTDGRFRVSQHRPAGGTHWETQRCSEVPRGGEGEDEGPPPSDVADIGRR